MNVILSAPATTSHDSGNKWKEFCDNFGTPDTLSAKNEDIFLVPFYTKCAKMGVYIKAFRSSLMANKLVSPGKLRLNCVFNPQWVLLTLDIVPHITHTKLEKIPLINNIFMNVFCNSLVKRSAISELMPYNISPFFVK